jgi:hypothetical protein
MQYHEFEPLDGGTCVCGLPAGDSIHKPPTDLSRHRFQIPPPPNTPRVATAGADDDPVERLAKEIADLSLPDAKRLLKVLEERI